MSIITQKIKNISTAWQDFWFAPKDLYNVSLMRCLLGLAMLYFYAIRFTQFNFYFSQGGILPVEWAAEIIPQDYRSILPFYFKTDSLLRIQGVAHLTLIVLFALGVYGRALTWLLFVVNLGLMQRNMAIIYGADLFCSFWLFYLSFVNHNQYFSILNYYKKNRRDSPAGRGDMFSTVGIRLIQIQICLSYAYTGIEKLKGLTWWEGSAIWYVIGMEEFIPHDFAFMRNFPILVALATMGTLIFEVYFIFAVWNKRLKNIWLIIGVSLHLGIAVFMNLWFFAFSMVTVYLIFLSPVREQLEQALEKIIPARFFRQS